MGTLSPINLNRGDQVIINGPVTLTTQQISSTSLNVMCDPTYSALDPSKVGVNQFVGCLWKGISFNTLTAIAPAGPAQTAPVAKTSKALDFNWGVGTPSTLVGVDLFSARWKGLFTFAPGTYVFTGGSDDGMRVRFNSITKLDKWVNRGYTTNTFTETYSTQTTISIELDFYENSGLAQVSFGWVGTTPIQPVVPTAPTGLKAASGDKIAALTWGVVTLANSYKIYRDNVAIGTATSPSFTNTGLTNGQTYAYKVSAVNSIGEGPFSSIVNATPVATVGGSWSTPFLTRPSSPKLVLTGQSNLTISNLAFNGISDRAITIENCSDITITACDLSSCIGGIYALNSTNITVIWNRLRNMGDGTIGAGHSNYIQFNNTVGGYIANNKGKGGNTEDLISIYQSGGPDSAHPLIVENNAFESPLPPDSYAWTNSSGSGSMIGDNGGSHIIVRNNTYLNPGQVGIGISGGSDIHILNNIIYGAQRTLSNIGMYVWNQGGPASSGIEVGGNRVWWKNAAGSVSAYWDAGNCGTVTGTGNVWQDVTIDPATLAVTL